AEEEDVLAFFDRGFHSVGLDRWNGEGNHRCSAEGRGCSGGRSACTDADARARSTGCHGSRVRFVDGRAERGHVVEVGFEVLEVEREVEDVRVGVTADRKSGLRGRGESKRGECCAAAEENRTTTRD